MPATAPSPALRAPSRRWPEVRGHWLRGVLPRLQHDPLGLYDEAWRQHGDYYRLRAVPGFFFYFLGHPDAIEHVLHTNHKNYRKPDSFNHSIRLLTGQGILNSEGEAWRRQRRLIQPTFLRASVARLSHNIVEATETFIDEWDQAGRERTIDVVPEMMRLALRVASLTLFSNDISGASDAIGKAYREAFEYVSLKMNGRMMFQPAWLPTARNRRFWASKRLLDRVVLDIIAKRRQDATSQDDTLSRLLAAQDEDSHQGMTDEQLKDESITLLTAGHETAGASLSWTWYLLAQHPEIQDELRRQVASHLQGRLPTVEDLPRLPLATAVFEESMRLYPPAWGLPRETIQPDVIQGLPIPAKATLVLSQWVVHRHPAFWPDPLRFDPGRFMPPQDAERHKFAFFPFGGGPRVCVGNHFAMVEVPLILAALIQRFSFCLAEGPAVIADPTFTLRPKHGVRMTVRRVT